MAEAGQGHDGEKRRYHTGDVGQIFHVSRASLVYYEKAGLIHPTKNPTTGLREYSISDLSKLYEFRMLANLGLTAEQIVEENDQGNDLFDERHIENYLSTAKNQIVYYEALRDALDQILALRLRDQHGPEFLIETIKQFIFFEDNAENSFETFIRTDSLDSLIDFLPISSFGTLYSFDGSGNTKWHWGRTIPTRLVSIPGVRLTDALYIGNCECVTMINHIHDDTVPPPSDIFKPLYEYAEQMGKIPAGDPFIPYMFPPFIGSPHKLCLPVQNKG